MVEVTKASNSLPPTVLYFENNSMALFPFSFAYTEANLFFTFNRLKCYFENTFPVESIAACVTLKTLNAVII